MSLFSKSFAAAALLLTTVTPSLVNGHAITECPTAETILTSSTGGLFRVCAGTDYQGLSVKVHQNVADCATCTDLCDQDSNCVKAVYDTQGGACHIKVNHGSRALTWVADSRFDVIHLDERGPVDGTSITACPFTQLAQTAGSKQYNICPGTDYVGATVRWVGRIASTSACVELCNKDSTCQRAVYDKLKSVCHIKDMTAKLQFQSSSRFDSINVVPSAQPATTTSAAASTPTPTAAAPADGKPITACPLTETMQTIDGQSYRVCPGADYVGTSIRWVKNVQSASACVQLCNQDSTCQRAVYDTVQSVCHVKNIEADLKWQASTRYNTIDIVPKKLNPATSGQWSELIKLPVIPVAVFVVPQQPESSRMLAFSSYAPNDFGGETGMTQFADFNFRTGAVSQRTVTNTKHDMFCPGISTLEDGRVIITGGSDADAVSIYDPQTNAFTRAADMKMARGYQSSTTLSDGRVFTIGGSYSGGRQVKNGEVYDPKTNQWTMLDGADGRAMLTTDREGIWREDNHGWLYGWRNGSVFQAGPSMAMNWYGTAGAGSVKAAGTRDDISATMCGVNVMYDAGKIFSAGGSPDYTDSPAVKRAHLIDIDQPGQAAVVERVADMKYARGFANAAVLPDGTVLITGGQPKSLVFTDTDGVLAPELFDPVKKTFAELAPQKLARNYHSVSLLLPDGTVFSGGGGLCYAPQGSSDKKCDRNVDHADGQIFSPPYLFNQDGSPARRPAIVSLSSTDSSNGFRVRVGGQLTVQMDDASGTTFALVRMGTSTHSINTDQRRIALTQVRAKGVQYTVTLPNDSGVVLPGMYYLFAMNKNNVPSMARTVQVTL